MLMLTPSLRHCPPCPPFNPLQLVQGLMQKLLLQLVAELQRLGATVVHADTSSIILATGKRNLAAAVGWVGSLVGCFGAGSGGHRIALAGLVGAWATPAPNSWLRACQR